MAEKKEDSKGVALLKLLLPPVVAFLVAGVADPGTFIERMGTLGGIATLVPIFVEFFKVHWRFKDKSFLGMKVARWFSWIFAFVLVYISSVTGWAYEGFGTLRLLFYGIGAGLISNGYFSSEQVKLMLAIIIGAIEDKEK